MRDDRQRMDKIFFALSMTIPPHPRDLNLAYFSTACCVCLTQHRFRPKAALQPWSSQQTIQQELVKIFWHPTRAMVSPSPLLPDSSRILIAAIDPRTAEPEEIRAQRHRKKPNLHRFRQNFDFSVANSSLGLKKYILEKVAAFDPSPCLFSIPLSLYL